MCVDGNSMQSLSENRACLWTVTWLRGYSFGQSVVNDSISSQLPKNCPFGQWFQVNYKWQSTSMRNQIILLFVLLGASQARGQVIITPSTAPVVNQGTTLKFTANESVTWSMGSGAKGSIDSDGTYHAPAVVTSQQSVGGCQVLPNDHIFNTRIDSLPVNAKSSAWIGGAGTVPASYEITFPINYVNSSTPTQNMSFYYTPLNNGVFVIPQYPTARIESGWFTPAFGNFDRHLLTVNPTACNFQEMYNYYTAGTNTSCATCTSQSGVQYAGSTYSLPSNGSTDAAGLYITPLMLRLQELENAVATGGAINHALRMTLNEGYCAGSNIWPAQLFASDGGTVPFGARFRLKASFDISGFSPIAKILLTQLKQYGLILADGGTGWAIETEYTDWPAAYRSAFSEIASASVTASNFEAVDESSLMVSPSSGATTQSETVVATSISNPSQQAVQNVVLTGVTLNLPKDEYYIQAGALAQQLVAYVNGSSNTSVTWTMNPTVGTLTSGGLYTPPATASSVTTATITATSVANTSVFATMVLTVFPNGAIRIVNGQTSAYTDSQGNIWSPGSACCGGDDGGFPYNNGGTWPSTPDIQLYQIPYYAFGNDMRFDIVVPNGSYSITGKFASTNVGQPGQLVSIEAQGQVIYPNVDIFAVSGGNNLPIDYTLPATVTNGQLSFVLRRVSGDFNDISALQIIPTSFSSGNTTAPPTPPTDLRATVQ